MYRVPDVRTKFLKDYEDRLQKICECQKKAFVFKSLKSDLEKACRFDALGEFFDLVKTVINVNCKFLAEKYFKNLFYSFTPQIKKFLVNYIEELSLEEIKRFNLITEPNVLNVVVRKVDCYNRNALWYFPTMATRLVRMGVDINHRDLSGQTVLFKFPEMSAQFKALRIDVNIRDNIGRIATNNFEYLRELDERTASLHDLLVVKLDNLYREMNTEYTPHHAIWKRRIQRECISNAETWKSAIIWFSLWDSSLDLLNILENFLKVNVLNFDVPCDLLLKVVNVLKNIDIVNYENFRRRFPRILNLHCSVHGENLLMKCLFHNEDDVTENLLPLWIELIQDENFIGESAKTVIEMRESPLLKHVKAAPGVQELSCTSSNCLISNFRTYKSKEKELPGKIAKKVDKHIVE